MLVSVSCEEVEQMIKKKSSSCPFCRQPEPKTDSEIERYKMRRIRANDPVALIEAGKRCYHSGDYEGAFEFEAKCMVCSQPPLATS